MSVLVPAFNQPSGVARILDGLAGLRGRSDVEIIVSDDSSDDRSATSIRAACDAFGGVQYRRNQPGLGAVRNWNALLGLAQGTYCWLLHHDEEPVSGSDLPAMLETIAAGQGPDAWLLPCWVIHRQGGKPLLHFPVEWAVAIASRWPGYLLQRNLFGAPSTIIARRDRYPQFDARLQWRVDVEAYLRLLTPPFELRAWSHGGLLSHRDARNSITAQLASKLAEIESKEQSILAAAHGHRPAVAPWVNSDLAARATRRVESVIWVCFRAFYRLLQRLHWLSH